MVPLAGSYPHGLGPVTYVSSVSCWAWLRPAASLGMCSGRKLYSLSLRAEGKGQSLGEACQGCYPTSLQPPQGPLELVPSEFKGLEQSQTHSSCPGNFLSLWSDYPTRKC